MIITRPVNYLISNLSYFYLIFPYLLFLENISRNSNNSIFSLKMSLIAPPSVLKEPIVVPDKQLMGPGPSNVNQRVLQAMALPTLGHLHPEYCKIMDDVKEGIRYAFQTKNELTVALSATGHAAMEAVMVNLLEPCDTILIAENGLWGHRAGDMVERQRRYNSASGDSSTVGPTVKKLSKTPGVAFTLSEIESALDEHKPAVFFITHGESSTGVVQNLEGIGKLCRR